MKKILLSLTFTFTFTIVFAQKESNNWYFGYNCAIDFNSGVPVSLPSSACVTNEGSASVSDSAGNLLFYTDGTTVWNKNNTMMYNGFGLLGNSTTTQSALIVSWPGSDSLYYIFTVDYQAYSNGLQYSIVDMSAQNGLGAVTVKNIFVTTPTTEKLTAVCQPNNSGYWIITHDWDNNDFLAYSLTSSGFDNTPVISSIGTVVNGNDGNTIGYLKASPDGKKLAQAIYSNNYFELFDFNDTTGIVSHDLVLPSYNAAYYGAYGIEFSPDGSKLYGSVLDPGRLYQWDLSAATDSAIIASQTLVGTAASGLDALQLASDGKIYAAEYYSTWLGVINDPNSGGLSCDFVEQGFELTYGTSRFGLPNFLPCLFASLPPVSSFAVSDATICEKFCVDFYDSSSVNPTSWLWEFPGGLPLTSTNQNPTSICYNIPGVYNVTLITSNGNGSDTLTLPNYITVYSIPPPPIITQNGYTLTSSASDFYQWQLDASDISGATNQSYDIQQSGFYTVVVSDSNGCQNLTTLYVEITAIQEVNYPFNISINPNPSHGKFILELINEGNNNLSIQIINTIGQTVYSSKEMLSAADLNREIDLSNMAPGVYCIMIDLGSNSIRKKIIVEN